MRICKRCLYTSNHPLGITFDDEGVCSGCRVHEEKDVLDRESHNITIKLDPEIGQVPDCYISIIMFIVGNQ